MIQKRQITLTDFIRAEKPAISVAVTTITKSPEGVTEYLISLTINSQQHEVFKRYSQFKSFGLALRSLFPRLELPSLPSKFSLYNKTEQRRKGFDNYLREIRDQ